jgi:hypothetical protein
MLNLKHLNMRNLEEVLNALGDTDEIEELQINRNFILDTVAEGMFQGANFTNLR